MSTFSGKIEGPDAALARVVLLSPLDLMPLRLGPTLVLTDAEFEALRSRLPEGWTDLRLEALLAGELEDPWDAHELFDIDVRDALDDELVRLGGAPLFDHPSVDLALKRIAKGHPMMFDDLLGGGDADPWLA